VADLIAGSRPFATDAADGHLFHLAFQPYGDILPEKGLESKEINFSCRAGSYQGLLKIIIRW
jgi:hypothetical protein